MERAISTWETDFEGIIIFSAGAAYGNDFIGAPRALTGLVS